MNRSQFRLYRTYRPLLRAALAFVSILFLMVGCAPRAKPAAREPALPDPSPQRNSELLIRASGLRKTGGNLRIAIFRSPEGFPDRALEAEVLREINVTCPTAEILFQDLSPGSCAIALFHDENENGQLDEGPLGIPREGYGFSGKGAGRFGPPSFNEAAVDLMPGRHVLDIPMEYLF
ncbi:DUF2141 domain-containing protein [bacterium]|nr:DUF2141 domain-containing protein [bacterium]